MEIQVAKNFEFIHDRFDFGICETDPQDWELYGYAKQLFVLEGGSGCFEGGQQVRTCKGLKPIRDVEVGERVLSFNEASKKVESKKVVNKFRYPANKKKCFKVKLKNGGEIKATEDHKFYYKGAWVSLKNVLSLLNGNTEKNNGK